MRGVFLGVGEDVETMEPLTVAQSEEISGHRIGKEGLDTNDHLNQRGVRNGG